MNNIELINKAIEWYNNEKIKIEENIFNAEFPWDARHWHKGRLIEIDNLILKLIDISCNLDPTK